MGVFSTSSVSLTGSMRVVMAQTTSFQSRGLISLSTTTMNLVYMNCRRMLQSPNITRLACPGYCLRMDTTASR